MAYDKLVDSSQLDSDLTSVANAIRTKGGTSASLLFPSGFVSAINDISGGGGGGSYPWYGPNTVLDYTKTITINLKNDTSWDSWTASTSATTILAASSNADFSYTYDFTQYSVAIVTQVATNYTYISTATKKAIPIANGGLFFTLGWGIPSSYDDYQTGTNGSAVNSNITIGRCFYYSTSGVKSVTSSVSSGGAYITNAPTISQSISGNSATLGYKRNAVLAKCSSSYFATARKADIDSENSNVFVKVYIYKTPISYSFGAAELNNLRLAMNASPANQ